MDELIFVRPSAVSKEAALAFRQEFLDAGEKINGSMSFQRPQYADYQVWLDDLRLCETGLRADRTPSTTLFALSRQTGEIVGIADIRHFIEPDVNKPNEYANGHVGGSVRPSMRGKGYGTAMLGLAVKRAAENGVKKALISCDKDNVASMRNIEKNGGVLDGEFTEANGNVLLRFSIDIYGAGKQA